MCRFLALILLSATAVALVSVLPAAAQDQPKDEHPAAQHARLTWEEHFTQANKAQDGHLTLDEAKAGYPTISRNFRAIDVDGKGFVTENDIRAWKALRKAARAQPREAADPLRPRQCLPTQIVGSAADEYGYPTNSDGAERQGAERQGAERQGAKRRILARFGLTGAISGSNRHGVGLVATDVVATASWFEQLR
jgi:hypothetical protein